jgi:hypothetical protein
MFRGPRALSLFYVLACTLVPHGTASQALVNNGPHPPPGQTGAKFIIREDGRRINLGFMRPDQVGHNWVVQGGAATMPPMTMIKSLQPHACLPSDQLL